MAAPRQFPVEYDVAKQKIREYQNNYYSGEIKSPSIYGFLVTVDSNLEELKEVISNPNDKNKPLSQMLKNFCNWMMSAYVETYSPSAPLYRQLVDELSDCCNGKKDNQASMDLTVHLDFGGSKDSFK